MALTTWQLWFVQLSGWPVFLVIVAGAVLFCIVLSVLMSWLSNRSVVENALLAVLAVALIGLASVWDTGFGHSHCIQQLRPARWSTAKVMMAITNPNEC